MVSVPVTPMPIIPAEVLDKNPGLNALYIVLLVLKGLLLILKMTLMTHMIVQAKRRKRWLAQLEELKGRIDVPSARTLQVGGGEKWKKCGLGRWDRADRD
jgi:hypothetical protein